MPHRYGSDAEFDDLLAELSEDPTVDNPYALANWILRRRYGANPHPTSGWGFGGEGIWLRERSGARFALRHAMETVTAAGWHGWTLTADDDLVATWQLPTDRPEFAKAIADAYIGQWSQAPG